MGLLVDRFRDVPMADRNAALCSRMVGLNLARVHVAPSRIRNAGRGLFASRAIASGELVTLYPCDALLQWPNEQALALAQREAESVQAVRDDLDGLRRRMEEQAASHAAAIPKHAAELGAGKEETTAEIIVHCDAVLATRRMLRPVVGDVLVRLSSHSAGMGLKECEAFDPLSEHGAAVWRYCIRMNATSAVLANPNLVEDAAYLGHLVNDGVICEGPGTAAVRYAITSAGLANVRTVASSLSDCHIALVSLRSIEQGGEILMSYGAAYWLSRQAVPPRRHSFPDGSTYYGEAPGGKIAGQGEFTDLNGNRYVGHFHNGAYHGPGTYYLAGGRAEVSRYSEGREVGLGAAWSADRQKAWRLVAASAKDGVTKPAAISLDDAASIAKELDLPVPPMVPPLPL